MFLLGEIVITGIEKLEEEQFVLYNKKFAMCFGWWGCHFVRSHQKRLGSFGGKLSQKLLF